MGSKFVSLNNRLYDYLSQCRSNVSDPLLADLRAETSALGEVSVCQISDDQGAFLSLLVAAIGARSALEIGVFTGYSSICIARGLSQDGRLLCLDQSEEWTAMARKYWSRAGLQNRIELRLGSAITLLEQLEIGRTFDFAFIDADKTQYRAYYEMVLPRVRSNGLILFDNMLWGGRLVGEPIADANGRAIDELNHQLACDKRVESVLISLADGIQLCRKI
jgi:caffeoyl-CoA O-methyltransferase